MYLYSCTNEYKVITKWSLRDLFSHNCFHTNWRSCSYLWWQVSCLWLVWCTRGEVLTAVWPYSARYAYRIETGHLQTTSVTLFELQKGKGEFKCGWLVHAIHLHRCLISVSNLVILVHKNHLFRRRQCYSVSWAMTKQGENLSSWPQASKLCC